MRTPRKGSSHLISETTTRGKKRTESSRGSTSKTTPTDAVQEPNSKDRDLPPNENIRKRADEVYGDTEIPERKPST
jgi:hypothetical protein